MKLADLGNITVADLLNKGSKTFKDLKVDISNFTSRQVADLLQDHPKAIYRPLTTDGKSLVVGFKPEQLEELLG